MPGTVPLRIAPRGQVRADADVPVRRSRRRGRERDARRALRAPGLEQRFRLIGYDQRGTGRSGLLRCPRLEKDPYLRDTGAAEECAEPDRPGAPLLHDARLGARHGGDPHSSSASRSSRCSASPTGPSSPSPTRAPIRSTCERLILDSVVDYDDPDPSSRPSFPRDGPVAEVAVPGPLPRASRRTRAPTSASSWPSCAPSRCRAFAYDAQGRSHPVEDHPAGAVRPDAR